MMNEEDLLKNLAVAEPSEDLDRRMARLFATAAAGRRHSLLGRPVALWQCAAVCALCLLAGWWFRPPTASPPAAGPEAAQVRYMIYVTDPKVMSVFDATQDRYRTGLESVILHPKVVVHNAPGGSPAAEGDAPTHEDQLTPAGANNDEEI